MFERFAFASLEKNPCGWLSLGELRSATSGFEAVLLSFLHSRVASEETSLLQLAAEVFCIVLEQSREKSVLMRPFWSRNLSYFLTQKGSKKPDYPLINTKKQGQNWSNPAKNGQTKSAFQIQENPGKPWFYRHWKSQIYIGRSGFFCVKMVK